MWGEGKCDKVKLHWTMSNKKLFLDLMIEENLKGNQPCKGLNGVKRENIVKTFNKKMGLEYGSCRSRTFTAK